MTGATSIFVGKLNQLCREHGIYLQEGDNTMEGDVLTDRKGNKLADLNLDTFPYDCRDINK